MGDGRSKMELNPEKSRIRVTRVLSVSFHCLHSAENSLMFTRFHLPLRGRGRVPQDISAVTVLNKSLPRPQVVDVRFQS